MKRLCFFAFVLLLTVAANGQQPTNRVTVEGRFPELQTGVVLSKLADAEGSQPFDTTRVEQGRFQMNFTLPDGEPRLVNLLFADPTGRKVYMNRMFAQAGHAEMQVSLSPKRQMKLTHAPLHEAYLRFARQIYTLPQFDSLARCNELSSKAYASGAKESQLVCQKEIQRYKMELIDSLLALYEPQTAKALMPLVYDQTSGLTTPQKRAVLNKLPADVNGFYVNLLRRDVTTEERLSEGQPAADFKACDSLGRGYSLADFRGKYLYLEFSASWCGWCKKEIPHIRQAVEHFKDKDVVFVTINLDDARAKWVGDMVKENMTWLCISDLQGMRSPIIRAYNIQSIPASFLISPDGKIVAHGLRGESIIPAIEAQLNVF